MKFEVLKKSHLKKNIIIGVLVVGIISTIVLNFTRARYRVTQSIPLVTGTINYTLADLNIVAITIDGQESDTLPEGNYTLLDSSYCTIDGENANLTINWDTETQALSITPFTTKGTKCYLDFAKIVSVSDTLLANYPTQLTRTDFSSTVTNTTTGTIYYEDTSKGRTYYFAGNPTDNWVSFAGYYWRIIRINENGSIRLIYSGDAGNGPSTTGSSTNISTSTWNGNNWDNTYVGYMYSEAYQSDYPSVHANLYDSMAKSAVDVWYENNLIEYNDYLDQNVGFCGDRIPYVGSGFGDEDTYYGPFARLSSYQPTFECENGNDYYTTKESLSGNNALTYPIGLISADEVAYAGGVIEVLNQSYYLYTGQDYWLISPHSYVSNSAYVFMLNSSGALTSSYLDSFTPHGVRPVINLRADVTISSGNGTLNSPYVIGS